MSNNQSSTRYWQTELKDSMARVKSMRRNGRFTDCQFVVQGEVIHAHKNILAMASPVFERMFYGNSPEKSSKGGLVIQDLDRKTFDGVLDYIYENTLTFSSLKMVKQLFYAAKKYMLTDLASKCLSHCHGNISARTACEIYEFSEAYGVEALGVECLKIFQHETSEVLKYTKYSEISIKTLLMILDMPEMNIRSEMELLDGIQSFVDQQQSLKNGSPSIHGAGHCGGSAGDTPEGKCCARDEKVLEALKKVRFLTMSVHSFARGPALSNLLLPQEKLSILMNIIAPDVKYPLSGGFSAIRNKRLPARKRASESAAQDSQKRPKDNQSM